MAIVTIRPNGALAAQFTVTGAASAWQALNDDSDASYIRRTSTSTFAAGQINFATTAITASQRVRRVRLRTRLQTTEATSRITFALGNVYNGSSYTGSAYERKGVKALATYEAAWQSVAPSGFAWDQTAIDSLFIKVSDYATTSAARGFVYELYADVDIRNRPTVTVSAPTGTVTASGRPTVTWSFTDADGDQQSYYQVKVFTAAQYTAVGFDASTSASFWDSGEVASSTASDAIVGRLLPNGTYRAYVRAAKNVNSSPFFSDWAFSTFTMGVSTPRMPSLTVSYSGITGRALVTAQGFAPTGFTSQFFQFQRSTNLTDWVTVRGADRLVPDALYVAAVADYEVPRGVTSYYRVRTVGVISSDEFPGAWSTPHITLPSAGANFASVPDSAALDITGDIELVMRFSMDDFTPTPSNVYPFAKRATTGNQRSWLWEITTGGLIRLYWSADGTTELSRISTVALPFTDGTNYWLRVQLDVDNGAAGHNVRFDWAPDQENEPATWTQVGTTVTTAGVTSIFASTANVTIGRWQDAGTSAPGKYLRAIVRSGLGGSATTVLDVDFTKLTDTSASSFTATTGQTVTLNRGGSPQLTVVSPQTAVSNDGTWWFKPVAALTSSIGSVGVKGGWTESLQEGVGVFQPIGRATAIVVSAGLQGRKGEFVIVSPGEAEWARILPVLSFTGTLYVEDPLGVGRYIRITDRSWPTKGRVASPLREMRVQWVEVADDLPDADL